MIRDWFSIDYLQNGDTAQQKAYHTLSELNIFSILKPFGAVLTGTYPLGLHIPESDLDICCQCTSLADLAQACRNAFAEQEGFELIEKETGGIPSLLIRFFYKGMQVEIFGQNIPVQEQFSFRHMLAEYRLLEHYGENLRQQVLELKKAGYKTEPAFALALRLEGDPYQSLLQYCP